MRKQFSAEEFVSIKFEMPDLASTLQAGCVAKKIHRVVYCMKIREKKHKSPIKFTR